ncbi:2-keto-4-pentenoate hydratase [Pseudomonas asiatica]|uniref:2-keto-4-pentenoate hydratase n=1 Tax=Pseudomonas asiatica TaxID=2219225 RepID=UPI0018A8D27E|nr:fumarylacetoacetate hydrolase family protein [Pseudomonas asiatica]MBF8803507.1 fumarylacetoacetate hydrolase family protein [Pseudomonas asiatica]
MTHRDRSTIDSFAELLSSAEASRKPVRPLSELDGLLTEEEAYAIQLANTSRRLAQGGRIVGRKIGLTSLAVQKQLGVAQPDFGTLFADMAEGDDSPIDLASLIAPKVEVEIALVLNRDLPHLSNTYADLTRAVDYAVAAIEVVDSRIEDWRIKYIDTVADNASSARFVLGSQPVSLANVDLRNCRMTLSQSSEMVGEGVGKACMGNPLNAAIWLADRMAREGTPLRAGDIVLTGALGPMVAVREPGSFKAQVEGLGSVRATFQ